MANSGLAGQLADARGLATLAVWVLAALTSSGCGTPEAPSPGEPTEAPRGGLNTAAGEAATLLARGLQDDRPADLVRGLILIAEPTTSPEVEELRVRLLNAMHLTSAAARVLDRMPWHGLDKGRGRLEALRSEIRAQPGPDRWLEERSRWTNGSSALGPLEAERIVHQFPGEAHGLALYELLGAWGRESWRGGASLAESAASHLQRARWLGDALSRAGVDSTIARSVQAIESSREEQQLVLAEGHARLARGFELFDRSETAAALSELELAARLFDRVGLPSGIWATYWACAARLFAADFSRVESCLPALQAKAAASGDLRMLVASVARTRGTVALRRQRYKEALNLYGFAASEFEALRYFEEAGVVHNYLADTFGLLGEFDEEWRERLYSIERLSERRSSIWFSTTLARAVRSLLDGGNAWAATPFAEEGLAFVETLPSVSELDRAEAELAVAWVAARTHQVSAPESLRRAEKAVATIPDADFRTRMMADLHLAQAELLAEQDAVAAIERFGLAATEYRRTGAVYFAAEALLGRARSWRLAGRPEAAEADLVEGIEIHEAAFQHLADSLDAIAYAEIWQGLFDEMVSLCLERSDFDAALAFADRAKDLSLGDRSRRRWSNPGLWLAGVASRLEHDEAVVEFTVVQQGLFVAVLRRSGVAFHRLAMPASLVESLEHWRVALSGEEALAASERLYPFVVEPIRADLTGIRRLTFCPDRWLNGLPFAALRSPTSGRYLVEDFAVATSPSVAGYERAQAATRSGVKPWRVAIVAPRNGLASQGLQPLPAVELEAAGVAENYGAPEILLGDEATKANLVRILPETTLLHFAGHARGHAGDPRQARLWLSHAAESLEAFRAVELGPVDLPSLRLVVLSACDGSQPSNRRFLGNDGMAAVFLARGVPAVPATLWSVGDLDASRFVVSFHRRFRGGLSATEALRQAQLEFISSARESDRHMTTWAAFQLTGAPIRWGA